MSNSVYKIIEVGESVRDLRIAEITKLDTVIDKGEVVAFRARVSLSFKYDVDGKKKAKK